MKNLLIKLLVGILIRTLQGDLLIREEHEVIDKDLRSLFQRILCAEGFEVFPYVTEDLILGEKLVEAGCRVLMPWGAPIGSGQGLRNPEGLRTMRAHFPGVALVVDAGIGTPAQAAAAMEMGYDAVLLNTAVAKARDPVAMARAFGLAVEAGRLAHGAGLMPRREMASPSTPVFGMAELL